MSNLKNLVAKANSGLSLRSTPKERFGLNGFLAASTDQMLMTRGGYGSGLSSGVCMHGGFAASCTIAPCGGPGGGNGGSGDQNNGGGFYGGGNGSSGGSTNSSNDCGLTCQTCINSGIGQMSATDGSAAANIGTLMAHGFGLHCGGASGEGHNH